MVNLILMKFFIINNYGVIGKIVIKKIFYIVAKLI